MINLEDLLKDHQLYHSELQQDFFITARSGGTLYGQYKQALREVYKRIRGLRESYCDREKLQIEIEEQKYIMENDADEFKRRYAEVEWKRKVMQQEEADRVLKETEREFRRFHAQALTLKTKLVEKHGELTEAVKKALDEDMWDYKIKENMVMDLRTTNRVGKSTLELVQCLPKQKRLELLEKIKAPEKIQALMNEYENREEVDIAEYDKMQLPEFNKEKILSLEI